MTVRLRACVLGVITNQNGDVLVGHRSDRESSWQFPQGGIDPGETPDAAILREMWEELGTKELIIIFRAPKPIVYHFPVSMKAGAAAHYEGQEQVWYHLKFNNGFGPRLEFAQDKEFDKVAWVSPKEALTGAVEWKRLAYLDGLKQLGLLNQE